MYIRLYIKIIRNFGSSDRIGSSPIRSEKSDDPIRSVYIPNLNIDFDDAVNFEQPSGDRSKKSVIFTDGSGQVEIKNEQVLINNKPASLPVKFQKSPSPPSRRY